jgi:hypothetical protein
MRVRRVGPWASNGEVFERRARRKSVLPAREDIVAWKEDAVIPKSPLSKHARVETNHSERTRTVALELLRHGMPAHHILSLQGTV